MSENKINNILKTTTVRNIHQDSNKPFKYLTNPEEYVEKFDIREIMALKMFKVIQDLEKKLSNGRIKDKETEKIRIDYLKTYINACNSFMNMSKNVTNHFYTEEVIRSFIDNDDPIIIETESDNE